jgi:hypothetical protein
MSKILNLESLPAVARYFPHLDVAIAVTGADGWANIVTTGFEPILGVHMVTSPEVWAMHITAFWTFYVIPSGSPLLVLISDTVFPIEISRYWRNPSFEADVNRKW